MIQKGIRGRKRRQAPFHPGEGARHRPEAESPKSTPSRRATRINFCHGGKSAHIPVNSQAPNQWVANPGKPFLAFFFPTDFSLNPEHGINGNLPPAKEPFPVMTHKNTRENFPPQTADPIDFLERSRPKEKGGEKSTTGGVIPEREESS